MNISIIDIWTQSMKHYIFAVEGTHKETLLYKRYSDANLGSDGLTALQDDAIQRNLTLLRACIQINTEYAVTKTILVGTQILRTASNAGAFLDAVRQEFGLEITILSHDDEAKYLFKGLTAIVGQRAFCAVNIGWWSTEIVCGRAEQLLDIRKIEVGAKTLRTKFYDEHNGIDWIGMEKFLEEKIPPADFPLEVLFITGVLDFYRTVAPKLWFSFGTSRVPNHPVSFSIPEMESLVQTVRATPIAKLKELYPQDPGFVENVAIGQTLYLRVAKAYHAPQILPSQNDLTDGLIASM